MKPGLLVREFSAWLLGVDFAQIKSQEKFASFRFKVFIHLFVLYCDSLASST